MAECTDGAIANVACSDADFGSLTSVVGIMNKINGAFAMTEDIRFPAAITGSELSAAFEALSHAQGASLAVTACKDPFVVNPRYGPRSRAHGCVLLHHGQAGASFHHGRRHLAPASSNARKLWPQKSAYPVPIWVGGMHAANEGIAEEELKRALRIYIR